jgi:hypothetical protein
VDFFLNERHQNGPAITFLTLYFVFFLLTLTTYLRLFLVIQTNPGVTPLGPKAIELKEKVKNRPRRERDLEAVGRYEAWPRALLQQRRVRVRDGRPPEMVQYLLQLEGRQGPSLQRDRTMRQEDGSLLSLGWRDSG